jgi:two-component system sensor histidine kinase YesM
MRIRLQDFRLRNKMLLIFVLCVLIPVVLTNVLFYNITTNNVKKQKLKDISLAMEQLKNEFLNQINTTVGISSVIYNDSILNDYLQNNYQNPAIYVENYQNYISHTIEKYSPVYKAIQTITIYSDNHSIVYGGHVLPITDNVRAQTWFNAIMSSNSLKPIIASALPAEKGTPMNEISVIRKMQYTGGNNVSTNILKIDISPDIIDQIFSDVTLDGNIYLLDGNTVKYSKQAKTDRFVAIDASAPNLPKSSIRVEENFPNIAYLNQWRIVGQFQENQVLKEVRSSKEFVFYLAIVNLVIPTVILILFTRSLNGRLVRILKHMKKVKNQFFEPIAGQEVKDEIGQLTEEFNRMLLQIKRLIHDVYIADIQKKELELKRRQAQLHALQSQINPHFLFNSLETIRMRSLMKQETETAKIIHNMAKIFRKSLSWDKDLVTIKDELDLVECFLQIQKYRFGDKLNYRIHVDEAAALAMIPKMTLQPLVENASIHGIEPLKEAGMLDISVELTAEGLTCTVRDNGVGIEAHKLQALQHDLEQPDVIGENVGIKNVYYRLKLFYGEDVDFRIETAQGVGTAIRIVIKDVRF